MTNFWRLLIFVVVVDHYVFKAAIGPEIDWNARIVGWIISAITIGMAWLFAKYVWKDQDDES